MLTSPTVVDPVVTALHEGEEALGGVVAHVAAGVLATAVTDGLVATGEVVPDGPVDAGFVGQQARV